MAEATPKKAVTPEEPAKESETAKPASSESASKLAANPVFIFSVAGLALAAFILSLVAICSSNDDRRDVVRLPGPYSQYKEFAKDHPDAQQSKKFNKQKGQHGNNRGSVVPDEEFKAED